MVASRLRELRSATERECGGRHSTVGGNPPTPPDPPRGSHRRGRRDERQWAKLVRCEQRGLGTKKSVGCDRSVETRKNVEIAKNVEFAFLTTKSEKVLIYICIRIQYVNEMKWGNTTRLKNHINDDLGVKNANTKTASNTAAALGRGGGGGGGTTNECPPPQHPRNPFSTRSPREMPGGGGPATAPGR